MLRAILDCLIGNGICEIYPPATHAISTSTYSFVDQKSLMVLWGQVGFGSQQSKTGGSKLVYSVATRLKLLVEFATDANGWLDENIGKLDLWRPDKRVAPPSLETLVNSKTTRTIPN